MPVTGALRQLAWLIDEAALEDSAFAIHYACFYVVVALANVLQGGFVEDPLSPVRMRCVGTGPCDPDAVRANRVRRVGDYDRTREMRRHAVECRGHRGGDYRFPDQVADLSDRIVICPCWLR